MLKTMLMTIPLTLPSAGVQKPSTTLNVMSYNIHHGESVAGTLELEAIADVIRTYKPDIIGLQEIDRHFSERSDFRDQAADLAKLLGMQHCFGANLDSESETPGKSRAQYGTAILSPHLLTKCQNILLPRRSEDEQRGLLGATVTFGSWTFRAYSTHSQQGSEAARLEQVDAILAAIPQNAQKTLLLGDLNTTPEAREIKLLTRRFDDSWSAGRGVEFTYPAEAPESRID